MATALKYKPHYTGADYQQWLGDWELWQGNATAMTPGPFGRHQHIVARLLVDLTNQLDVQSASLAVPSEIKNGHVSHQRRLAK